MKPETSLIKTIRSTGTYQLSPGSSTSWFDADDWRLIYVENGKALYSDGDKNFEVEKGDLFLLGPNQRKIICADTDIFTISIVFFEGNESLKHESYTTFGRHSGSYFMLREMFLEIHSHEREPFHRDLLSSLIGIFLRDKGLVESGDARIRKALQMIRRQKGWRLTSAQMAKTVGLSRAHFNKLFKEQTGSNYASFCREARMNTALTLMQEYGLSAKQAAWEIGSSSAQAFSREFKARFGKPPGEFLKG